jgi:hypothetical protein
MGGGGSNKVDETPQQKAFAKVAMQKWADYGQKYRPYENKFMRDVDRLNTENSYQQASDVASVPVESEFTGAVMNTATQMTSAGLNPNSGKFQEELNKIDRKKQQVKADVQNQAQIGQQDRYVSGVQNIVRMGQGQSTQAMQGLGDVASMANQRANADANVSAQNRYGTQQAVGATVGGATRYGLNQSSQKPATALEDDG